jgi:hypothetical protein
MGECMHSAAFYYSRHTFEGRGQLHYRAALAAGKEPPPGTHWIGGCVGPRAGLYYMEK